MKRYYLLERISHKTLVIKNNLEVWQFTKLAISSKSKLKNAIQLMSM